MMEQEEGITEISKKNIKELVDYLGQPALVMHHARKDMDHSTLLVWNGMIHWYCNGFASGYSGEGPHGLQWLFQEVMEYDLPMERIAGWDNGYSYLYLRGGLNILHLPLGGMRS